jgi:2-C-methyl-D-erythritol 4-phosphate cytidylyltransferase
VAISRFFVIIAAAGIGSRMQADRPKQYLMLDDKTVIEHAIAPFLDHAFIEKIVVVLSKDDHYFQALSIAKHEKIFPTLGGDLRAQSVLNGLNALIAEENDWVLVHDAARPLISREEVDFLIETLSEHPVGGLLGTSINATIKYVERGEVKKTVSRDGLWQALTPQMFRYGLLKQALAKYPSATDCSSAIEQLGKMPHMVEGNPNNIKITRPEDLRLAERILS